MTEFVKTSDIIITDDRHRKAIAEKELTELEDSISRLGLFHALLVEDDGLTLLAGHRRFCAIFNLHQREERYFYDGKPVERGTLPVIRLSDLSPLHKKEIELEENTRRVQLHWREEAAAISEIHRIRTEQAEAKGKTQTRSQTAQDIYKGEDGPKASEVQKVSHALIIDQFSDDEEVMAAKTADEALKLIEKKLIKAQNKRIAEEYDPDALSSAHTLIQGDLREEMLKLPDGKFDCIIADPPYGIDADTFRNQAAVEHTYQDDEDYANGLMAYIAIEGMRITKDKAHIYVFCDINRFAFIRILFEDAGWYVWKWPLIWYKGSNVGILPVPGIGPRRTYEAILYGVKGKRKTLIEGAPDVLTIPHDKSVERGAHKPPDLYEALINRTCLPGHTVLDPCAGTAPLIEAANQTRTTATCIELDPVAFGQALKRLKTTEELEKEDE